MKAGLILQNKYRLISPIGEGGMGTVWRAEHLDLGVPVAVKLMHAKDANSPLVRPRFEAEARTAAILRSPHVVQVLDSGVDSETRAPFIIMELLEGESLRERIERIGPLRPLDVARIVSHVARALSLAHNLDIVHRDLKPANIFLTRDAGGEIAKVLDFGVAKHALQAPHGSTATGTLLGTPHYMSPEQIRSSKAVDYRTDLWSLGVLTVECLTGKLPFDADNLPGLALRIYQRSARAPSSLGLVPTGVDAWFERATQLDPAARFDSAAHMAAELERVCCPPPEAALRGEQRAGVTALEMSTPRADLAPAKGQHLEFVAPPARARENSQGWRALSSLGPLISTAVGHSVHPDGSTRSRGAWRRWAVGCLAVLTLSSAAYWFLTRAPATLPPAARVAQAPVTKPQAPPEKTPETRAAVPVIAPPIAPIIAPAESRPRLQLPKRAPGSNPHTSRPRRPTRRMDATILSRRFVRTDRAAGAPRHTAGTCPPCAGAAATATREIARVRRLVTERRSARGVQRGESLIEKGSPVKRSHTTAATLAALVFGLLAAACGDDSSSASNEPPSDRFFRAVYAGSAGDGSANVLLFNPAMAEARGSTVVVPEDTNAVLVEVFSETGAGALTGTWTSNGRFTAAGTIAGLDPFASGAPRYEVSGEFSDTDLTATLTEVDPNDPEFSSTSEIAGVDINDGRSTAFCGEYSGSSSGAWNFVVQDTGNVRGSYTDGPLSGEARGEQVNLDWSYPKGFFCSGGGEGTASGAVNGSQGIAGTWSGTACGDAYGGSWEGRPCQSPSATFVDAGGASGSGSSATGTAGGRCDDPESRGTCFAAGPCCYETTLAVDWTP